MTDEYQMTFTREDELYAEVETLEKENAELKAENEELKKEVEGWKKRAAEVYWDS